VFSSGLVLLLGLWFAINLHRQSFAQALFSSILQYDCGPDTLPELTGILSAAEMLFPTKIRR